MIDLQTIRAGDLIYNDALNEVKLIISISFDHFNSQFQDQIFNITWLNEYNEYFRVKFSDTYIYRWIKLND